MSKKGKKKKKKRKLNPRNQVDDNLNRVHTKQLLLQKRKPTNQEIKTLLVEVVRALYMQVDFELKRRFTYGEIVLIIQRIIEYAPNISQGMISRWVKNYNWKDQFDEMMSKAKQEGIVEAVKLIDDPVSRQETMSDWLVTSELKDNLKKIIGGSLAVDGVLAREIITAVREGRLTLDQIIKIYPSVQNNRNYFLKIIAQDSASTVTLKDGDRSITAKRGTSGIDIEDALLDILSQRDPQILEQLKDLQENKKDNAIAKLISGEKNNDDKT